MCGGGSSRVSFPPIFFFPPTSMARCLHRRRRRETEEEGDSEVPPRETTSRERAGITMMTRRTPGSEPIAGYGRAASWGQNTYSNPSVSHERSPMRNAILGRQPKGAVTAQALTERNGELFLVLPLETSPPLDLLWGLPTSSPGHYAHYLMHPTSSSSQP